MYVRDGVPPEKGLTKERIKMDVKKMRFPTPEARTRYMNARAIAERCAAEVPAEYRLEDMLWGHYPPSFDDLLGACGEDEDASRRYQEREDAVRNPARDRRTHERNFLRLDASYGQRLAAYLRAHVLFCYAVNERQQRDSRQLTPEDLTRALLNTEGKFQSAQERAVAILKG